MPDYHYLCLACGAISAEDEYEALHYNEDDELVPAPSGWSDPLLRCPRCLWIHSDDAANPGLYDGEFASVERDRARELAEGRGEDWIDGWAERYAQVRTALIEARPYIFNRVVPGSNEWRSATARDVLGRVDAALGGGARDA